MVDLHIGKQIKIVLDSKDFTVTEFAKRINKSRENIYSIFSRKSIDTELLQRISAVLEHDFFQLYINSQPELIEKLERFREENKLLKELNTLLKEKISNSKK